MDVRCLGNGRPFIMEVIKSKRRVNEKVLKNIRDEINEKRGLNSMGDIDLKVLTLVRLFLFFCLLFIKYLLFHLF